MPSSSLVELSLVYFRDDGWGHVYSRNSAFIYGVDRSGQVVVRQVSFERGGTIQRQVFVGTSKSCGFFAPSCKVIDACGASVAMAEIVEGGRIGELTFEQVLSVPIGRLMDERTLCDALAGEAAMADGRKVVVRIRSTEGDNHPAVGLRIPGPEGRHYWVLNRQQVTRSLSARPDPLIESLTTVFRSNQSEWQVSRAASPCAMLASAAFERSGSAMVLEFDALQHTAVVTIRTETVDPGPLGVGRTAQYVAQRSDVIAISWEDASWHPLVNGLVAVNRGT
jgi:hypothetical protein